MARKNSMTIQAKSIRIIINADDLGMNTHVNDVILNFLSQGLVTSATLIANAPAFEDAATRICKHKNKSFGAHLNVTQYKPLTNNHHLKPLLNADGSFGKKIFTIRVNQAIQQAVYEEWSAQIEKIQSCGILLSHIDSHQHVHTLPQLFLSLKKIQKKYNIRKVRISKNIYSDSLPIESSILRYKKLLWNSMLKIYYPTRTTSAFTDFSTFYEVATSLKLCYTTVEIMTHPGSTANKKETALLQTSWINEMPFSVDLIDYTDL